MKAFFLFAVMTASFFSGLGFGNFLRPELAEACRNCPFPTPIDERRWAFPGGLEFELIESEAGRGWISVSVQLIDSKTKYVIASGISSVPADEAAYSIDLVDSDGNIITGSFTWVERNKGRIRAAFRCSACSLKPKLDSLFP